jgi:hypothetical protein
MLNKLLTFFNFSKLYLNYKYNKLFAAHNISIFKKKKFFSNKIILIELNNLRDCHILYSYVVNILAEKFQAQIHAYVPRYFNSFINFLIFKVKHFFKIDYFKIYLSFNVSKFFYPLRKFDNSKNLNFEVKKILNKLKNKSDIYNISVSNINIGDLIYDAYLRKYNLPTVDLDSKKFKNFLFDFISLFFYWENYFKKNDVRAAFVSHAVYEFGIVVKIAINLKIPIYIGDVTRFHRLNKRQANYFDMRTYREDFKLFPVREKKKNLEVAKYFLDKKFSGEATIENFVSNLPNVKLFGNVKFDKKILKSSKNYKCLIAPHHFSDAPNAFGKILFNDFYEWVDFLGKLSEELDYDWYIRLHPSDYKDNIEVMNFFLKKYPKFTLINSNISHSQLIYEGIDLVLTVYGSIALEYAYFKIPVINASINNPHISYNFNYHPKNIKEYKNAIINFKKLNINFDKNQIYEYFFMRYLCTFYIFPDQITNSAPLSQEFKGYQKWLNYIFPDQMTNPAPLSQEYKAYQKWLNIFNETLHFTTNSKIKKFIESNKYRMKVHNEIKF